MKNVGTAGATPGEERRLRILIVDDDEVDRLAVRRALIRGLLEAEVTEAVDVAGARAALDEDPDCVIVDYQLPDGSGEDVLAHVRTRPESPPVIVLTGQGDEDLAVRLMKKGARDYIAKGQLDPARLAKSVRQVVDVTRAEREAVRARRAQEFLLEVSAQLAQSLDHEATMQRVAGLPVPAMADYAVLYLRDDDGAVLRSTAARRDGSGRLDLPGRRLNVPEDPGAPLARVLDTGEALLLEAVDEAELLGATADEEWSGILRELRPRSVILAPLQARGRVLGCLATAYTGSGRRYDEADLAIIKAMAGRAALALDNARLYQELRDEVSLVDTLRDLGERITSRLDREVLVQEVVDRSRSLTGASVGVFLHPRAEGEGLGVSVSPAGAPSLREDHVLARRVLDGEVVRASAGRDGGGDLAGILAPDPDFPEVKSLIAAPVESRAGSVTGALLLIGDRSGTFQDRDLRLLRGVVSWASVALHNADLYEGAQEAARARDDMLAVVSHDLRNPLNVIATSASLILEIPLDEERKREQLRVIKKNTDRMNRLIQDLLDVTSIEAGRLHIEPTPETVSDLLEDVVKSMATLADEACVKLEAEAPAEDPVLHLDRERMVQAFGNLVGNALKFTPEGGRISVGATVGENEVVFYVQDTGPGITDEDLPHLFDRFWRGSKSRDGGAGLGLPIVRGIAEAHKGTVDVETERGEGTRISFTVPRSGS